ncbi:Ku protein [Agrococcus sp. Marseille-Q4369]|uniref:non-homologous end joining protein Ku n=1 Tax=Agrococcus sp. Marseille-Q4369 TaxID=2810513 RepID=UPI001B8DA6B1|nr:Ku protein [Agrococcus sp. Marseille-Q4369]QUW18138.1 Ku protein [Agrococcus sp. Marseille-Q4369]
MRAIWKGSITFGLVNVPVKLYSATEEHDLQLHQVHDADGGRIRYQRKCEVCGKKVEFAHIDKAYDDGDQTVVLTGEDLEALPAERSREIEVLEFVPNEQIDPILFERSYYLEPDSKSPKAYVLLRRVLEETERTAIVRISLRQRTRLATMRVRDDVLLVQTIRWSDEVRAAEFDSLGDDVTVGKREMDLARSIVRDLEADFDPEQYVDEYQEQLHKLVEAKLEQGDALDTAATFGETDDDEGAEVIDLLEALQRSVEKRKGSGSDASEDSGGKPSGSKATGSKAAASDARSTAKRTAKSGAAAKKPAERKPAEKKPAAKKSTGTSTKAKTTATAASKRKSA